jgi:plastocyanin
MMTLMQYEGFKPVEEHSMRLPVRLGHPTVAKATSEAPKVSPTPSQARSALPSKEGSAASRVITIPMVDNRFVPVTMRVRAGTRIRWLNRGQNIHTTTSLDGSWDSPGIDRKQGFAFTFVKLGEYRYICRQHLLQGMVGTIIVK